MPVFAVSVLLGKQTRSASVSTHTLSVRSAASEDEARASAIVFALAEKPGFAVESVLCAKIEGITE